MSGTFDARTRAILCLIAAVVFIAVVNGTMINIALPYIGADFGVTEGTYGWIATGYSLSFGIFNAVNGKLADLVGKRRLYVAGLVVLGLGSIAVTLAPSVHAVIALRVAQGVGGAALPVVGTSIIKDLVRAGDQGKAVGIILSTVGVAASIGPFLGGAIVQYAHWRVVFALTAVTLLAVPAALWLLPRQLDEVKGEPFDAPGAILMGFGIASLLYLFHLVETGAAPTTIGALFGLGVLSLAGFWARIHTARHPFITPAVLGAPGYWACCAIGAAVNAARFGSVVVVPIMLTNVNKLEPLGVGAVLFPGAIAVAVGSPKAGAWADRVGPKVPVAAGLALLAAGGACAALFAGSSPWGVACGMALFGLGYAAAQSPLVSTINRIVPAGSSGSGVGFFMMIFFIGGGAGVAAAITLIELFGPARGALLGTVAPGSGRYAWSLLLLSAFAAAGGAAITSLPSRRQLFAITGEPHAPGVAP